MPHPRNRTDLRGHPDLALFDPGLPQQAEEAFEAGDVAGFFASGPTQRAAAILFWNFHALWAHGIYEKALLAGLRAMANTPENWGHVWLYLFRWADPKQLRTLGDPFPHVGPFTLYRGVAGDRRERCERGLCWTEDFERARWFATRFDIANPRVFSVSLPKRHVLAYLADPGAEQFLVLLPETANLVRVWPPLKPKRLTAKERRQAAPGDRERQPVTAARDPAAGSGEWRRQRRERRGVAKWRR